MKTKKKKNRIILCLCSIIVLVASVFAFIPMNKETKTVYADTVTSDYSFSGSNISSKTTFTNFKYANLFDNSFRQGNFSSDTVSNRLFSDYSVRLTAGKVYTVVTDLDTSIFRYAVNYSLEPYPVPINYYDLGWVYLSSFSFVPSVDSYLGIPISYRDNSDITLDDIADFNFMVIEGYYDNNTQVNYEFDFYNPISNGKKLSSLYHSTSIYDTYGNYYRILPHDPDNILSGPDGITNFVWNPIPPYDDSQDILFYFTTIAKTYYKYDISTSTFDESISLNLYYAFFFNGTADVLDSERFFSADVVRINIGSYLDYGSYFNYSKNNFDAFDLSTEKYNFISYVDSNNFTFNIFIPLDSNVESDYFTFRTYYLNSFSDAEAKDYYDSGYSTGYREGYNSGNSTGTQVGYQNGYKTGKNDGYNLGYNQALENGQKYTFTALISSVIDVPVKAFTSLFNFEILGVNLSGFFLGLLTCCITIAVIRFIL